MTVKNKTKQYVFTLDNHTKRKNRPITVTLHAKSIHDARQQLTEMFGGIIADNCLTSPQYNNLMKYFNNA